VGAAEEELGLHVGVGRGAEGLAAVMGREI
jgi:hypothetical protein